MKQLSIVIVNYNVAHFLELCLSSVFKAITKLDAEVIVVDNASSDTSCDMVRQRFPKAVLIANKDNVGFATANNQGVAVSQGEYVCILNPDTVVGETVFDEVYAYAKKLATQHIPVGIIGVRLVDGTGNFLPECKRNLPTPKVAFNKLFGSGDAYYARDVKPDGRGKIHVLVGAFMFMTKKVYQEAGGFDEQYFMYGEDIDLSHTITQLGYENHYLGDQTVIHFKGESTAKNAVYRERFYNAMGIFYNKHLKSNFIEGGIVNFGLWYAKKFHRKTASVKQIIEKAPQKYVMISKNTTLVETIQKLLEVEVVQEENVSLLERDVAYLFDMRIMSYKDCIQYMLSSSNGGSRFKFIPQDSTFALGSNSSDGRGKLLQW